MSRASVRGRRATLLLAVAFVAAGFGLLVHQTRLLRRLEQQSIDARFQIRGAEPARAADVVLVEVDASTFDYLRNRGLPSRWPFPRRDDARVIERLHRAGAGTIAVDIQFTEPSDARDDDALIEAVDRAGGVVLSTTEVGAHGRTAVLGGDAELRRIGARAGNANVVPDGDGVLRNMGYSLDGLRTFGVVVAAAAAGRPVSPRLFGGLEHPVPIDYAGPPGTFRAISYSRVLSGRFPPRLFAGKTVIVGAAAPSLQDLHQTPTSGSPMAGPEIVANEATTVLAGIPLRPPAGWVTIALVVLAAAIVPLAALRLGTLPVALVALGVLVAWSIAAQLAFDGGVQLDYADPVAALAMATLGAVLIGLWADGRERRRLRQLFAADASEVVEGVLRPSGRPALEPTAIIAGYRIETAIGRGGMGVVYRAMQLVLDRPVALKLIATDRADDPAFRARFELESRLGASIEHPNVIPVYEAGEDDGLLYIAMRLVDGVDLAELLGRGGALEPRRVARLITQLGDALDAAHAHGLVHRDVKPANVLLTIDRPEHLYLTDFGVAKAVGGADAMTVEGGWVGTRDYIAPEQLRGEEVGSGADIYALACLLYLCLTGEVPFPRDDDAARLWAHVNAPAPAPTALRPDLPPEIDAVIARGMAKDPADRYRSAGELAAACAAALGEEAVAPEPDLDAVEEERRERRPQIDGTAPTVVPDQPRTS